MKKIISILFITIILLCTVVSVKAANYKLKELIPEEIKTTIVTKHFSYRSFYYDGEDKIIFTSIKNISDEDVPFSITIALFDEKKENIGTINYCKDTIKSQEEKPFTLEITKDYLGEGKRTRDIKYISVLSENENCRTTGSDEFIGQTVEEIGMPKNTQLDTKSELLIQILTVVGGFLLFLFVYKLLFTNAYENVNGDDVRQGYNTYNKELKDQREYELRVNPPKPKEVKKIKTDEVLTQEEQAKTEDKSGTDLHNMYK